MGQAFQCQRSTWSPVISIQSCLRSSQTEKRGAARAAFQAHAKQRGAADLMIPGEVLVVERLPVLGSGKLDHVAVARLARERAAAPAPVAAA